MDRGGEHLVSPLSHPPTHPSNYPSFDPHPHPPTHLPNRTIDDIHYSSPSLDRLSQYEPCGFGAGTAWDVLRAICMPGGAPVMRARVTYLGRGGGGGVGGSSAAASSSSSSSGGGGGGGGSVLSVSVAHTVLDAKSVMKVKGRERGWVDGWVGGWY